MKKKEDRKKRAPGRRLVFPLFLIIVNNQKLIGYYPINICTSTNAELN